MSSVASVHTNSVIEARLRQEKVVERSLFNLVRNINYK